MPANVPHWDFNALPVNAKLHLQRDPMYAEKRHIEQSFRSLKMLIGLAEDVSFLALLQLLSLITKEN